MTRKDITVSVQKYCSSRERRIQTQHSVSVRWFAHVLVVVRARVEMRGVCICLIDRLRRLSRAFRQGHHSYDGPLVLAAVVRSVDCGRGLHPPGVQDRPTRTVTAAGKRILRQYRSTGGFS